MSTHAKPGRRTAWLDRIRSLRLAGRTLDEARAEAGPMPPDDDLDAIAGDIAHDVLDECLLQLEEAGVSEPERKALAAAYFGIASTDAIAGEAMAAPTGDPS